MYFNSVDIIKLELFPSYLRERLPYWIDISIKDETIYVKCNYFSAQTIGEIAVICKTHCFDWDIYAKDSDPYIAITR